MVLLSQAWSNKSVSNDALISPDRASEAVAQTLRLFIGRGRKFSVEDVAEGTGIPARTLRSYIATGEERRAPSGDTLLVLSHFLGRDFSSRLLGNIGQGTFDLNPAPGEPGYVIATLIRVASVFAELGVDQVFCNGDKGKLAPLADLAVSVLTPFTSQAR